MKYQMSRLQGYCIVATPIDKPVLARCAGECSSIYSMYVLAYLSLPFEPRPLQMLVEAAQYLVGRRPDLGVIAAEGGNGEPQPVAGHELQTVDLGLWKC